MSESIAGFEITIDVDCLRRNVGGDVGLATELVEIFEEELTLVRSAFADALRSQDREAFAKVAHRLKGSLLALGARCAATVGELEVIARTGYTGNVEESFGRMEQQLAEVIPALRNALAAQLRNSSTT